MSRINTSKTILLVEDEALIAMREAEILEDNGFQVIKVYNAQKAIETADKAAVDLILMDIDLGKGKMDGTEAAEIILKHHDVPIVFLSSHTEPEIVEKTEKITSYGYIVKNSGKTVLLASIKMAFRLKQANDQRIEMSNQLDTLLDNAEDLIGRLDRKGTHLYVNQALCDVMGISCEEYVGKTLEDVGGPPELVEKWSAAVEKVFDTAETVQIEFSLPETSGPVSGEKVLECKIVPEIIEEGEVKTVVAISRDITERRRAEHVRCQSEEMFLKAFQSGPMLMTISVIEDGTYIAVNDNFVKSTGYSREETIGKTSVEIGFATSEIRERMKEALLANGKVDGMEMALTKKSGEPFYCRYFGEIIEVDGEKRLLSIAEDISGRMEAERVLRESEEKYRVLLDLSPVGIYQTDKEGNCVYANFRWLEMAGMSMEEAMGQGWMNGLHPDDRETIGDKWYKSVQTGGAWGYEYRFQTPEGKTTWVYGNAQGIYDAEGDITGYIGTNLNITDRKKKEEELKKNEVLLNEAQELANIGSFVWDLQTDSLEWSRNMYAIAGLDPESFCGNLQETISTMIHPDDRGDVFEKINEMIKRKKTWPMEFRLVRPNGDVRWLRSGSRFIFDEKGVPIVNVGIHRDFTDQKQMLYELRESRAKYTTIVKTTIDGFWQVDLKGNLLDVNDAGCIMSGYSREELLNMNVADIEALENPKEVAEHLARLIREGHSRFESAHRHKNGTVYPVEVSSTYFAEGDGMVLTFIRDITERKKWEKQLRESLKEKDYLMKELNHRVKNNLAIISSLISLKNSSLGDEIDLSDIRNQIDAIRIVHEKLYATEEITRIDFSDYIGDLLATIFSTFAKRNVTVENNTGSYTILTKSSIALGLIVNEIATNAIKHGFLPDKEAKFSVTLQKDEGNKQYVLTVANNGKPFPEDVDLDHPETLGLRLISALTAQLEGTIELKRKPHPVFTIRFPLENNAPG